MIHIVASTSAKNTAEGRRLPFYLAMEEWVARRMPAGEYFFTWRVAPTVIFGRNQDVRREVNLDYCREHGIQVYRRRSGGGCVYADPDNLMLSYITPSTDVASTFARYSAQVADMLRGLGLDAEASGRNDVLVSGKKVSGNAFYLLPQRSIVHGTMLFGTDVQNMTNAITPDRSKLMSNQVQSVPSRITTLSQHLDGWTVERLQQYIVDHFTDSSYELTESDIAEVEQIEQGYYDLKWIFGRSGVLGMPKDTARISKRIPGVGGINLIANLIDGKIQEIEMTGDFFIISDLDTVIYDKVKGCALDSGALAKALEGVDVSTAISGLSTQTFIDLLTSASVPIDHHHA